MHVCFVSDTLSAYFLESNPSGIGGAERQQYLIANALRRRGVDVSVATSTHKSKKQQRIKGIDLWHVIPDVRGLPKAPYKTLRTMYGLHKINADIYYVRGNDFLCITTGAYIGLTDRDFVYAVANDANVDPTLLKDLGFLRHLYVRAIKSADQVIAQTNKQRELLQNKHGIDAVQIPNGYTIPDSAEIIAHADRDYVLWVGSIDPEQKHPERFLRLAEEFPETQFVMIGPPDNDQPEHYETIEREANSIPNLEFLGFVDPNEIHDYYRRAITLVNTSDYEGFPNVFLEAWRYETPVISLHHSLDGVLNKEPVGIHAGSMENLVDALEQILTDDSLQKELGEGGREYMIANYSFEKLIDEYKNVFEKVMMT